MIFLDLELLLVVAERSIGEAPQIRDVGLLESALARPQATAFGTDAYPDLLDKAAALLHSLAKNHALIDGNKRLALGATIAFLGLNGVRLTLAEDEAYDLVISVASGAMDDIAGIAAELARRTGPRLR